MLCTATRQTPLKKRIIPIILGALSVAAAFGLSKAIAALKIEIL
jgi:hypothetical protein